MRKTRRIEPEFAGQWPHPGIRPGAGWGTGCAAELTEVLSRGEAWWTLGFESVGPPHLLRSQLEAAAALVFAESLPGEVEPGLNDSRSYAEWLLQWPGAGDNPHPKPYSRAPQPDPLHFHFGPGQSTP